MQKTTGLLLALALGALLSAQEGSAPGDMEVFAPFATDISVAASGPAVTITWSDAPAVEGGTYLVYRSGTEITKDNFAKADKLGEVPAGTGKFTDSPPDGREYYYAVLVRDRAGTLYQLFIPFKDKTVVGVAATMPEAPPAPAAPAYATVAALKAAVGADSVTLSFASDLKDRSLVVYRSTAPILAPADLLGAAIVDVLPSSDTSYADYPVPGIGYYYALLDEEAVRLGEALLVPGSNASDAPATIPAGPSSAALPTVSPLSRSMPLPYLMMDRTLDSGGALGSASDDFPDRKELSSAAVKAAEKLLKLSKKGVASLPAPETLDAEASVKEPKGENYTLKTIVDGSFGRRSWKEASYELEKFLSLRRSPEAEARARFYLGQCLFFQGSFRDALFQFLSSQDYYFTQSQAWVERTLVLIRSAESED